MNITGCSQPSFKGFVKLKKFEGLVDASQIHSMRKGEFGNGTIINYTNPEGEFDSVELYSESFETYANLIQKAKESLIKGILDISSKSHGV
jgi:hypothetical protein